MVESLKELNKICQKQNYKTQGNWMVRNVLRDAALPLTWVLLHTPISANQVTLIALMIGILGEFLFIGASPGAFLAGALFLQLWYLLDHVDGQIARYRKTATLSGRYFDFLMHHIIHGVLYFFLGVYCYRETHQLFWLFLGFMTSFDIVLFNLSYDITSKAILERIRQMGKIAVKKDLNTVEDKSNSEISISWPKRIYSLLHKSCEIHVAMNLLTLFAVLDFIFKGMLHTRFLAFVYYALCVPSITLIRFWHVIQTKKVDQEFEEKFE